MSAAKRGKGAPAGAVPDEPSVDALAAARMALWVSRARAGGALLGFALGLWVSRRAGIPMADATLRALLAAAALSLVAWWSTLLVLQALIRTAAVQRTEEVRTAMAEAAAANADRWAKEDDEIQRRLRRRRGEPDPDEAAAAEMQEVAQ